VWYYGIRLVVFWKMWRDLFGVGVNGTVMAGVGNYSPGVLLTDKRDSYYGDVTALFYYS
jgi:hypothetical protein